jgi:hypothetical protein
MFLAPDFQLSGCITPLPGGVLGVWATVRKMRALVNEAKVSPFLLQTATQAIFLTPEHMEIAELSALFNLVQLSIRYQRDVSGVETLSDPVTTLQRKVGDCDDQSMLLAALFESVGYATRFVIAGYHGTEYEHVYLQVLTDFGWTDCDPTERQPLGYAPPNPTIIDYERV